MTWNGALATVADLVLPRSCLGCARPGTGLCPDCARVGSPAYPHRPDPVPAGFPPTWTAAVYGGAIRSAVLAYKERGRTDLAPALAGRLATAARAAAASGGRPAEAVLLVPVPSARRASRRRGGDHLRRLAGLAAREGGAGWRVLPVLRLIGRPRDSAGLTAGQRAANLDGAFAVRTAAGRPGCPVVLLDDVVTTGATLATAATALHAAGYDVRAATVAATRRHGLASTHGQREGGPAWTSW